MTRRQLSRALAASVALAAIAPAAAVAQGGGASAGGSPAATTTTTTAAAPATTSTASTAGNRRPSSLGTVRVSSGRLNVRKTPTRTRRIGSLKNKQRVRIICQTNAGRASGRYGASRIWNKIKTPSGRRGYVADATIQDDKSALVAPYCGAPDPGAPAATNPQQGRCSSVATVALVPPPATREAFITSTGPLAQASSKATGVPASVTLAQGILESASGTATAGGNNYFGIKAQQVAGQRYVFTWGPNAVGCVHRPTFESEGGRLVRQIAQFRMYRGTRQSFDDHGAFLRNNSRYAPAFRTSTPQAFARAIHKAGYATDPQYANKLIALMSAEKLTRFDR